MYVYFIACALLMVGNISVVTLAHWAAEPLSIALGLDKERAQALRDGLQYLTAALITGSGFAVAFGFLLAQFVTS